MERALGEFFFKEIVYLPTSLAEATYLLGKKERAGYAILLDVGYLTSTVSVVYGNGIVHEKSFTSGIAEIKVSKRVEFWFSSRSALMI